MLHGGQGRWVASTFDSPVPWSFRVRFANCRRFQFGLLMSSIGPDRGSQAILAKCLSCQRFAIVVHRARPLLA
jgi:hypothetical protein